jgi:hypothetical protein
MTRYRRVPAVPVGKRVGNIRTRIAGQRRPAFAFCDLNNASAVVAPTVRYRIIDGGHRLRAAAVGSDCAGPLELDESVGCEARAFLLLLSTCYLFATYRQKLPKRKKSTSHNCLILIIKLVQLGGLEPPTS